MIVFRKLWSEERDYTQKLSDMKDEHRANTSNLRSLSGRVAFSFGSGVGFC